MTEEYFYRIKALEEGKEVIMYYKAKAKRFYYLEKDRSTLFLDISEMINRGKIIGLEKITEEEFDKSLPKRIREGRIIL